MTRGEPLHQLQKLDLELENGQRRTAEIQASLGESQVLRQARRALSSAQEELREWKAKSRDLELEIASLNNKTTSSEKRLYSGSVTNPKELSDIQEEIASLKRRRRALEDELLEAMVYGEEAEATAEERHAALTNIETKWETEQAALKQELSQLETRIAQVHKAREALRAEIKADDLQIYDHIRERYGPQAVVTLRDGVCGFCAVSPSSIKLKRIKKGQELLQCSNCHRILLDL